MDLRASFGFHTTPFTREIRPEEQFTLPLFDEALAGLLGAVEQRMSGALIAPVGTGKTQLLGRLMAHLPAARYQVRYIKLAALSSRDLCREIAQGLGLAPAGTFPALLRRLQDHYEQLAGSEGLRPVLLIDEASDLRPEVLAMLRLLTNFQMDTRLVSSLVLAGNRRLGQLLGRDDQEAVARRLAYYAVLRPLGREESTAYLQHRSRVAGVDPFPFEAAAVDALYEISRGNLRALDGLALGSLQVAARARLHVVSPGHVIEARKGLAPTAV